MNEPVGWMLIGVGLGIGIAILVIRLFGKKF